MPTCLYLELYFNFLETATNVSTDESAITATWHKRRGRTCKVPVISSTAQVRMQNIRRVSFTIHGLRIFNSLQQYIRDTTKCDTNLFKAQLDEYPEQVPDQPLIPGCTAYRRCESNSLIDWTRNAQLKAKLEDSLQGYHTVEEEAAVHSDLGQ